MNPARATAAKQHRAFIEKVARELATVDHRVDGSFISTPLLYPSGSGVVVRVDFSGESYFVSDMGFGYQEADMMGASLIYSRHAPLIAEDAGVGFDNHSFFVVQASKDQLAGAVVAVANCSLDAVSMAAHKLSERKVADAADRLHALLTRVFPAPSVAKNVEVKGASTTTWPVASLVRIGQAETIFEPVINHRNSVASVVTKFHDISLLEHAPGRVSVVRSKDELGTLLNVLSQAGSVITRDVSDAALRRLAKAA
jgi:hypothetical protein